MCVKGTLLFCRTEFYLKTFLISGIVVWAQLVLPWELWCALLLFDHTRVVCPTCLPPFVPPHPMPHPHLGGPSLEVSRKAWRASAERPSIAPAPTWASANRGACVGVKVNGKKRRGRGKERGEGREQEEEERGL